MRQAIKMARPGLSGHLVYLVCLVCLVYLVQPNKQDKPDRPDEPDRLVDFFSILPEKGDIDP